MQVQLKIQLNQILVKTVIIPPSNDLILPSPDVRLYLSILTIKVMYTLNQVRQMTGTKGNNNNHHSINGQHQN